MAIAVETGRGVRHGPVSPTISKNVHHTTNLIINFTKMLHAYSYASDGVVSDTAAP